MSDTTSAPVFPCRCRGCRRYPFDWFPGVTEWRVTQDITSAGSFYFSTDTRRFFSSRVLGIRILTELGNAAIVTESKAAGFRPSDGRDYCATLWCKFGQIVSARSAFSSSQAMRMWLRSRNAFDWASEALAGCECHGCIIQRAEVTP